MRYARILSKLYAQPLLLQPSAWHAFDHALRDVMDTGRIQLPKMPIARIHDDNPDLDGSDDDCPPSCAPARMFRGVLELRRLAPDLSQSFNAEVELPNDTAIIHFDGVLDKHISMMDMMCYGGVDLDDIDAALAYVAADANIRNVLLVFNSPGGSVIGVPETAARVEALSRAKNVITFSDSVCCSGAVYIGSQASEFFVTASTYSGSIGVIRPPILDFSEALKERRSRPRSSRAGSSKTPAPCCARSPTKRIHAPGPERSHHGNVHDRREIRPPENVRRRHARPGLLRNRSRRSRIGRRGGCGPERSARRFLSSTLDVGRWTLDVFFFSRPQYLRPIPRLPFLPERFPMPRVVARIPFLSRRQFLPS
jgi:hypothetical protein